MAGLYVHVPFRTASRCYDDAVYERISVERRECFVSALRTELSAHAASRLADVPVHSVYVGGGRPSLLSLDAFRQLWNRLSSVTDLSTIEEITVEVNPSDATPTFLRGLRDLGVTRLSVEVLSFAAAVLKTVEAPHSAAEVEAAVRTILEAGFDTFSVDLCLGVPNRSINTWKETLRQVVALGVPHVTLYELTDTELNENTRADELEAAMTALAEASYNAYSFPNFARPGHRSVHQQRYDAHQRYLGVGPSAESFWRPTPNDTSAERWTNVAELNTYVTALRNSDLPIATRRALNRRELAREHMLLRLRSGDGLDIDRLYDRYGVDLRAEKGSVLNRLVDAGLVHDDFGRVRLTNRGHLVADAVARALLSAV